MLEVGGRAARVEHAVSPLPLLPPRPRPPLLSSRGRRRRRWRMCGSEPTSRCKSAVIKWLRSPCRAPRIVGSASSAPREVGPCRRGVTAHHSHTMRWWEVGAGSRKELIFACSRCGGLGTDHFRSTGKLTKKCAPPTRTGQQCLEALEKGLAPGHTKAGQGRKRPQAIGVDRAQRRG